MTDTRHAWLVHDGTHYEILSAHTTERAAFAALAAAYCDRERGYTGHLEERADGLWYVPGVDEDEQDAYPLDDWRVERVELHDDGRLAAIARYADALADRADEGAQILGAAIAGLARGEISVEQADEQTAGDY